MTAKKVPNMSFLPYLYPQQEHCYETLDMKLTLDIINGRCKLTVYYATKRNQQSRFTNRPLLATLRNIHHYRSDSLPA